MNQPLNKALAYAQAIRNALAGGVKTVGNTAGKAVDAGVGGLLDALTKNRAVQENMVRPQAEQGAQAMGYHNLDEWAQKNPEAANQKDMLTTGLSKLAGGISKAYSKIKSKIK